VVDGDTIDVAGIGRIRLIGIDTPEVYGGTECYGPEASAHMRWLVGGTSVNLEYDMSQGDPDPLRPGITLDRYDRVLAYVWVGNANANLLQVRGGYAEEYLYRLPYRHYAEFVAAEQDAQVRGLGLWGAC
jgi:micrococcal nuclease